MSIINTLKRIFNKPPAPLECIEKEMKIEDAKTYFINDLAKIYLSSPENQNVYEGLIRELNPKWEQFKSKFKTEDKLYLYNTPREHWDRLAGIKGFIIVRNDKVVEKFQYLMN